MRRIWLILFINLFLINISFAGIYGGSSLIENSYFFRSYIDGGLNISVFSPYLLFVFSPDTNFRFWGGAELNSFPRIGGGYKLYPNLSLNFEYREKENYLEVLFPFSYDRLRGGLQINIGILGSSNISIEGSISYLASKVLSFGAYLYFPFQEGKSAGSYIFIKYLFRDYYFSLALDNNREVIFSFLKFLKI